MTGEHYQLSQNVHTDRAYFFHPILQWGHYRALIAQELVRVLLEGGIDLQRDIDVLVATGIAAMQICCTLQHFVGLQQKRLIFIERDGKNTVLGHGFSFAQDERVLLVQFAAVRYRTIRATIKAIHEYGDRTGVQPCVVGFAVLFDRSPNRDWERDFAAFRKAALFREPLRAYRSGKSCPLCRAGVPLVDLRGAT